MRFSLVVSQQKFFILYHFTSMLYAVRSSKVSQPTLRMRRSLVKFSGLVKSVTKMVTGCLRIGCPQRQQCQRASTAQTVDQLKKCSCSTLTEKSAVVDVYREKCSGHFLCVQKHVASGTFLSLQGQERSRPKIYFMYFVFHLLRLLFSSPRVCGRCGNPSIQFLDTTYLI